MLPLYIVVPLNIHPWLVQLNNTDGSSWGGPLVMLDHEAFLEITVVA